MDTRQVLAVLVAASVSILLSGCGDDSTGPQPEESDWYPLAGGNSWQYDLVGYVLYTPTDLDTLDITGAMRMEVPSELQHQGGFSVFEHRTLMEMTFTGADTAWTSHDTLVTYLRNTGSEMRAYEDLAGNAYQVYARFPITQGDSWVVWPDSGITRTVVSTSESYTVPEGSFSGCALIRELNEDDPYYMRDYCVASDVGIVVYVAQEENPGEFHRIDCELESYLLN